MVPDQPFQIGTLHRPDGRLVADLIVSHGEVAATQEQCDFGMIAQREFHAPLGRHQASVPEPFEVRRPAEEEHMSTRSAGGSFSIAAEAIDHGYRPRGERAGLRIETTIQIDAAEPPAIRLGDRGEHDADTSKAALLKPLGAPQSGLPGTPSVGAVGLGRAPRRGVYGQLPSIICLLPGNPDRSVRQVLQRAGQIVKFLISQYITAHQSVLSISAIGWAISARGKVCRRPECPLGRRLPFVLR
jgi:hypothetical protein